jgi:hypothetical protein
MKNLGLGLMLALLCLAPGHAQPSPSFLGTLQRFKAAPLQPQSLRKGLLPADIKEINALLAQYEQKRRQGQPRRRVLSADSQEATRQLLVALAAKAYEVSRRGQISGNALSKEHFAKGLTDTARGRAISPALEAQTNQLLATHQSQQKKVMHASKAGKAAKSVVDKVDAAAESTSETAGDVATTLVSAAEAVVSWLTS